MTKLRSKLIIVIIALALLGAAAQKVSAASFTVNVGQGGTNFVPATLTINQGDTVNWNWVGGFHNVTSGGCPGGICASDGKFNSGAATSTLGNNFSFTFNTPGTFPYYCSVHLSAMQGTIIVSQPAVATRPSPSEVPEADSLILVLGGGVGLASFLGLKWRARKRKATH